MLQTVLGRRILWRTGRALYQRARGDVGNHVSTNGERDAIRAMLASRRATGQGIVFFDVGANLGAWTLAAREEAERLNVADRLDVHVFEPVQATFDELSRRLSAHVSRLTLVRAAVSDAVGTADMFITAPGAGTNTLVANSGVNAASVERVQTTTVDEYCRANAIDRIDYLKVDAEGHDWLVLSGAKQMLAKGRIRVAQFEYNHRWIAARHYLRDVFDLVQGLPYSVGKILPGRIEAYQAWHPELERFFEANYVLVHDDERTRFPVTPVVLDQSNTFA